MAPCSTNDESSGCAFLRAIRSQLDTYVTTGGAFLETIHAHREVFAVYPSWHIKHQCADGFRELARALEQKPWAADPTADAEAVNAFKYEAYLITVCSHIDQNGSYVWTG